MNTPKIEDLLAECERRLQEPELRVNLLLRGEDAKAVLRCWQRDLREVQSESPKATATQDFDSTMGIYLLLGAAHAQEIAQQEELSQGQHPSRN